MTTNDIKKSLAGALLLLVPFSVSACVDEDGCDDDQIVDQFGLCRAAPAPPATGGGDSGGGLGGAGGGGGAPVDPDCFPGSSDAADAGECGSWGETCAVAEDCTGGTVCAAEQGFPICTQGECQAGGINEGICPPGWSCFESGGEHGCVNF